MENFESIDDYLSNRLGEQERAEVEQKAASDPSLKADLELQRQIISGVQQARKAELKAMLNNIPVGGSMGGMAAGKIAAAIVSAGVIGSLIYFYASSPEATTPEKLAKPATEVVAPVLTKKETSSVPPAAEAETVKEPVAPAPKTKTATATAKKETITPPPVVVNPQPKIDVVDPSAEMENSKTEETTVGTTGKTDGNASRVAVDTDATNRKFNFHYRFSGNKLMLYGPFDKSLYEILEINGSQKLVFLYYKEKYYLLSDKQSSITPLEPITDAGLVKKLRDYRDSKK